MLDGEKRERERRSVVVKYENHFSLLGARRRSRRQRASRAPTQTINVHCPN